ncbi:reverse transcriptase domain-containing protein [Tanacetum coccineum]
MTSIMAPWPFYQWGMDILGPLTPARRGAKFVIVAIDYFTKWVEAKPLVKITGKEVIRFVMDNIICRYGLPRVIVTDNGAQLVSDPFKSWCTRFEIQQMNTAVAHPQANGLVERANRSLMEGIKTRLGKEKAGWPTYGSKSVIPAEIGMPSYQTLMIREEFNEEEQCLNLDLLQERREAATIREARYKTKWNSTTIRRYAQRDSGQESLCIEGMRRAEWRIKESSVLSGKPIQGHRSV